MSSPEPMGLIEDIALPASDAPPFDPILYPLHVYVSHKHVFLGEGNAAVVTLPDPAVMAKEGFGVPNKRGPNDLRVLPLQAAVQALPADKRSGAIVLADASLPYRVVIELLFTLAESGCEQWVMATLNPAHQAFHGWRTAVPVTLGESRVSVVATAQGYVVGESAPVALPALEPSLHAVVDASPLAIAAKRSVPYQAVIDAVTAGARAGFSTFAFQVAE